MNIPITGRKEEIKQLEAALKSPQAEHLESFSLEF